MALAVLRLMTSLGRGFYSDVSKAGIATKFSCQIYPPVVSLEVLGAAIMRFFLIGVVVAILPSALAVLWLAWRAGTGARSSSGRTLHRR
jgi:hypothetical protein